MAATPDTIRQSDLINRLVINIDTAEEVGRVTEVLVDPQAHQVEGIVCKAGLIGRERQIFSWVQIESIGKDSVVVRPVTDHAPHRLDQTQPMLGQEVWSDAGDRVGRLVDLRMNARTGLILAYGYAPEGLRGATDSVYSLLPGAIISVGRKRLMVQDAAVAAPAIFEVGWVQKATAAADALKEDYANSQDRLDAARQNTQDIADQVQDRARQLKDTAKTQWGQVFGQVKQRTRKLRHQLRETVTDVTANLPAGGRSNRDENAVTIDVDSLEVWPDDESTPDAPTQPPQDY